MRSCCIIGCTSRTHERNGMPRQDGVKFYGVPQIKKHQGKEVEELTRKRRLAWVSAIRTTTVTFEGTNRAFVCSNHFNTGKPAYEQFTTNPDWAPSLHLGHALKEGSNVDRYERTETRQVKRKELARKQLNEMCDCEVKHRLVDEVITCTDISTSKEIDSSNIKQDIDCSTIKEEVDCSTTKQEIDCATIKEEFDCSTIKEEVDCSTIKEEVDCSTIKEEVDCLNIKEEIDSSTSKEMVEDTELEATKEKELMNTFNFQNEKRFCNASTNTEMKVQRRVKKIKSVNIFYDNENAQIYRSYTGERSLGSSPVDNKNGKENCHQCEIDCVGFSSDIRLMYHKRIHLRGGPCKSDVCDVTFSESQHLWKHKSLCLEDKPFKCDVCGVRISDRCDKVKHKRIHTGEKPFLCDICGGGFSCIESLRKHKKLHSGEKPYKCDVCGAGFIYSYYLQIHKRKHTGEKPFLCDVCGAGFAYRPSLVKHKSMHTGEKPYKCEVCGVGFSYRAGLLKHKIKHAEEKPYKCDFCGGKFTHVRHLNIHKRIHT